MEFVKIQGSDKPVVVYEPYIIKTIKYYSKFFTVDNGKEIKVILEDTKEVKNGRNKVRKISKNNRKENRKTKTKKRSTHKK